MKQVGYRAKFERSCHGNRESYERVRSRRSRESRYASSRIQGNNRYDIKFGAIKCPKDLYLKDLFYMQHKQGETKFIDKARKIYMLRDSRVDQMGCFFLSDFFFLFIFPKQNC